MESLFLSIIVAKYLNIFPHANNGRWREKKISGKAICSRHQRESAPSRFGARVRYWIWLRGSASYVIIEYGREKCPKQWYEQLFDINHTTLIPNRTFLVRFGGISAAYQFGRAMTRPNEPDMSPKRTKKVRLGLLYPNSAQTLALS